MRFRKFLHVLLPGLLSISLSACTATEAEESTYGLLSWPQSGLATLIPDPDSQRGQIFSDDALKLTIYASDYSKEQFVTYIAKCQQAGFILDEWITTNRYSAENEEGYILVLSLDEAQDVMRIDVNLSADEDDQTEESESEHVHHEIATETNALKVFRNQMNEYEDFFVDYCNFVRTYRSYGLSEIYKKNYFEYGEYRVQYKRKLKELKELSQTDLDEEERFIYEDAMSRIDVVINLANS